MNSCKRVGECCRMSTNIDLIHSVLVSSDPFIVNVRPLPRKQTSGLSPDVLQLISLPHQQLGESPELHWTECGKQRRWGDNRTACLPPGVIAYCAVVINTVTLLNMCQFAHYEASTSYFIQQNSHHNWTTVLANYWRALVNGGLVQPIFSTLRQHHT